MPWRASGKMQKGRDEMMIEPYLSENDQKEALSYAYLHALAAECGYSCQRGPQPDKDSVDATIRAKGGCVRKSMCSSRLQRSRR